MIKYTIKTGDSSETVEVETMAQLFEFINKDKEPTEDMMMKARHQWAKEVKKVTANIKSPYAYL